MLRIVEAPTGSGKTLGVARWASRDHAVDGVLWLDAGRLDAGRGAEDRELFWSRMRSGLADLGVGPIAPVPARLGRRRSLGTTGSPAWPARWNASGGRRLLVLDDYPSGPSGSLGRQLSRSPDADDGTAGGDHLHGSAGARSCSTAGCRSARPRRSGCAAAGRGRGGGAPRAIRSAARTRRRSRPCASRPRAGRSVSILRLGRWRRPPAPPTCSTSSTRCSTT